MMKDESPSQKPSLSAQLRGLADHIRGASRYAGMAFFLFLAALYGFLVLRINTLTNVQPDPAAVESQVESARIPKVDAKTARQLESLESGSSNVKALFDSARQNPFQ